MYIRKEKERGIEESTIMQGICRQSRDNGRSPMQWNASEGNGFSSGTPWIKMGRSASLINAENDLKREDGVFHYYKSYLK